MLFCAVFTFLLLNSVSLAQQDGSKFWIYFETSVEGDTSLTLLFGNQLLCTNEIDSFSRDFREYELPPLQPGLDARWVMPQDSQWGWGNGLDRDYRGVPLDAEKSNKYFLQIVQGNADDAEITIVWPPASYLSERCDSMFFEDISGLLNPPRIDMFAQDTLRIPNFISQGYKYFYIYKYGVKLVDSILGGGSSVKQENTVIPTGFALSSNYPNPFNPVTTIRFDIQKRATADIAVYNALGQKVITLVSEDLPPGTYSTIWNGANTDGQSMSSGVYYVRMIAKAVDGNGQDFSALRKLILLK